MNARKIQPAAFLFSLLLFGSFMEGRPLAGDLGSAHTITGANPLPTEPEGASRCKVCHASEVEGYSRSAMAHSLRRAGGHEPTGTVTTPDAKITMYSNADGFWQRLQAGGEENNYHIDYVIGSGNHASGYLVDIAGHLFQSPVAFYKRRNAYDLAPGYENIKDPDFTRPVAEGCVFCHSGTELHVTGTENQYRSPVFPVEAISCERCHGPGEKHLAEPRAGTIINPAKLEPGARDSICEQCHLFGAARVTNPGREFRDFQPGQRLETTFTAYHEVLPPGSLPGKFKVISHVEQLAMSACARNSQGRLWCGTCHDPHNKPTDPVAYYRSRCLSCHTGGFSQSHPDADSNCISCHMPRRNAQDGGHTAFTDHRIQRRPEPQNLLPIAGDIAAWREPAPDLRKRNLGIAYISAGLQRRSPQFIVRGYRLLTEVQEQFASDPEIFTSMGTALLVGKHPSEAELAFDRALALRPDSAVAEMNAAAAHQQEGDIAGTIAHLESAVAIDPLHLQAASLLITLYRQEGNSAKADELLNRVRSIMEKDSAESASARQADASAKSPKMAEAVYKNIKVLRGIPADQLIPTMRFITSALGVQCSYCHVKGHFEDDAKKPKQVARKMMRMMLAINEDNFAGTREVTCNSCHRGAPKPQGIPAVESVAQLGETSMRADLTDPDLANLLPTAEDLVDNYIRALGGAEALQKITSRTQRGVAQVEGKSAALEFYDKGNTKWLSIQHNSDGDSVTALDGDSGWVSAPGRPTHDLAGADLDAARMDADLQVPLHLKTIFPELKREYSETIDGRKAYVMMGVRPGKPAWKFFFDAQSGLLTRLIRYAPSPLGLNPTQIDYRDYRSVGGVQIPFAWTIATPRSVMTIHITTAQQNVAIDDTKFLNPSTGSRTGNVRHRDGRVGPQS
ncbi:MAG: c-type cytochrome [Terriglobales bacterium]